jgi:PAS domain S-box-containing protein
MLAEDWSVADYECEVRGKDGEPVILSSNAIVMRDAEGKRIGVTGISKDITARKRMEAALRESEERFRQLADNIREVFWISKFGGEKIYVSPGYEDIWGRSLESLNRDPHSWIEAIYPDDLPAVLENQERMTRGQLTDIEYRIIRPDGALRWIRDRSYPMKRGDGTRLICGIAAWDWNDSQINRACGDS